jgi:hypothetical protein
MRHTEKSAHIYGGGSRFLFLTINSQKRRAQDDDDERHQTTSGPLLLVSFFSFFSQILFSESRFYHRFISRWVLLLRVVPLPKRTTVFYFPGEEKERRFGADDGDVD